MVKLKIKGKLTDKEVKKYGIPRDLTLTKFNGMQYAMCFAGIQTDYKGDKIYNLNYTRNYINTDITPDKLISFCETHKNDIVKEKIYDGGHIVTVYYIVYSREEKPTLLNEFNMFDDKNVIVEITLNEPGYYMVSELKLKLLAYTPILSAIETCFEDENLIKVLEDFVSVVDTEDGKRCEVEYYDDFGRSKSFYYDNLKKIYDRIVNVRLVGYE